MFLEFFGRSASGGVKRFDFFGRFFLKSQQRIGLNAEAAGNWIGGTAVCGFGAGLSCVLGVFWEGSAA